MNLLASEVAIPFLAQKDAHRLAVSLIVSGSLDCECLSPSQSLDSLDESSHFNYFLAPCLRSVISRTAQSVPQAFGPWSTNSSGNPNSNPYFVPSITTNNTTPPEEVRQSTAIRQDASKLLPDSLSDKPTNVGKKKQDRVSRSNAEPKEVGRGTEPKDPVTGPRLGSSEEGSRQDLLKIDEEERKLMNGRRPWISLCRCRSLSSDLSP
ncbi:hypothetical protein Salat_2358600 [Sesamum alatum]|uniref:Uncharacterized protein n=1 Tax=Sesamum alatum TaxID=300844 RepID=A0AAE1XXK6_9LAMI|nr:hypothetical protein Salat_2358600 [Sesamum alatum]